MPSTKRPEEESDILLVPDMARKLNRTESSIRSAVNRAGKGATIDWLPPRMSTDGLQWYRPTVDAFLQGLAGMAPAKKAKRQAAVKAAAKKIGSKVRK